MIETASLRRYVVCLDGQRVPLNSSQRADFPGDYPYWGANGVVDSVGGFLFDEELILLGEDGAPFDDPLRDVAFHVRGRIWVNNHIHVLRPRSAIDPRFLMYALNAVDWMPLVSGSTRLKLTRDDMMRAQVSLYPMIIQRAIADYLDSECSRIDALIAKKRRLVELLYERKLILGEEVLSDLRQSEQSVPLKYLVRESDVRYGSGPAPTMLSVSIHHGVVPRSTVSDKESSADNFSGYKVCRPGDIAINRMRAFQGGVGVVGHGGVVSPDYTVLRVGDRVSASYLHFVMRSSWFVSEMTRRLRGIGSTDQGQVRTPRINVADLGLIEVPVPSSERQHSLALSLTEQEARLASVVDLQVKQLAVLAERRQALITAAVTGELKMPGVAA